MGDKWSKSRRQTGRSGGEDALQCGIQTLIFASNYIEKMASTRTVSTGANSIDSPVKQELQPAQTNGSQAATQASTHTRTYQACLPCRNRKVRCDLGPVDNPHDPPCQRCRREQKECVFSATRRKRNPNETEDGRGEDGYEIRNGRKRTRTGSLDPLPEGISGKPLTPQNSFPPPKPVKRSSSQQPGDSDEDDLAVNNDTTAMLQQTEVFDGRDALNLLFEAADARGDLARHRSQSASTSNRPVLSGEAVTTPQPTAFGSKPMARGASTTSVRLDSTPGQAGTAAGDQNSVFASSVEDTNSEAVQNAVKAWSGLRFVKAGLFTATEAIGYIDYFYRFLSPMTPVTVPDFHNPMKHRKLLQDEPMLAMTLLTVASRYVFPPGPGSTSRGIAIHERLWSYLQGMIDRMIWGQEQFGGGFCGAGSRSGGAEDGSRVRGLRSLGAIESLLLLTEWHTRALHFPPSDDTDELIPPDEVRPTNGTDDRPNWGKPARPKGRKIDSWLEPIYRSDRMSWSLLSNALALAYELGVYSKDEVAELDEGAQTPTRSQHAIRRRFKNIKDLLFVYVTQISGRLNLPSMLQNDDRGDYTPDESLLELIKSKHQQEQVQRTGGRSELVQDVVLYFWCRLSQVMKEGNRELFPTRAHTRLLISSGKYGEVIQRYSKVLAEWRSEFDACVLISSHMRHILNIEYEYIRVYVNLLALQAVVERCTNNTPTRSHAHLAKSVNGTTDASKLSNETIPPSILAKWLDGDRKYIRELVQASQNCLKSIITGLLPGDYLKHASVRTYFRIISVSMILLKTFALGASEEDAATSLSLFDKAADALRTCIVDDVHVGSRIAELIGTLTHRVRANLIRVAANGAKSGSASHAESRAESVSPVNENTAFRTPSAKNRASLTSPPTASGGANGISAASLPNKHSVLGPPKYLQNQQQWALNNNQLNGNNLTANNNLTRNTGVVQGFSNGNPSLMQPQLHKSISPYMNRASNPNHPNHPNLQQQGSAQPDPLYGISAYDYDPDNPAFSIMPPPSFNSNGNHPAQDHQQPPVSFNSPTFSTGGASASGRFTPVNNAFNASPSAPSSTLNDQQGNDWLALPLDPILNIYGADVTQGGGYGPELGGTDMLDLLLADQSFFAVGPDSTG